MVIVSNYGLYLVHHNLKSLLSILSLGHTEFSDPNQFWINLNVFFTY